MKVTKESELISIWIYFHDIRKNVYNNESPGEIESHDL